MKFRKLLTMLGAMIALLLLGIPGAAADTPDLPTADQVDIPGTPSIVFGITASDAATKLVVTIQDKSDGIIGIAPQLRGMTPTSIVIYVRDDYGANIETTTEVYANPADNAVPSIQGISYTSYDASCDEMVHTDNPGILMSDEMGATIPTAMKTHNTNDDANPETPKEVYANSAVNIWVW